MQTGRRARPIGVAQRSRRALTPKRPVIREVQIIDCASSLVHMKGRLPRNQLHLASYQDVKEAMVGECATSVSKVMQPSPRLAGQLDTLRDWRPPASLAMVINPTILAGTLQDYRSPTRHKCLIVVPNAQRRPIKVFPSKAGVDVTFLSALACAAARVSASSSPDKSRLSASRGYLVKPTPPTGQDPLGQLRLIRTNPRH